jgi:hypothetical protein
MLLWIGVNGIIDFILQIHITANSLATGNYHDILKSVSLSNHNVGFSDLCRLFEPIVR